MIIKVNCKYNDKGAWCTNKNIKRSLFGIGARCCSEYNNISCDLKESRKLKGKLIIKKLTDLNNKRFFFDGYIWYKKEDGKGIEPLNYIETRIMKKNTVEGQWLLNGNFEKRTDIRTWVAEEEN